MSDSSDASDPEETLEVTPGKRVPDQDIKTDIAKKQRKLERFFHSIAT